ncbi:MAG TPA: hypothetical protein VME63_18250 [Dyella sp.]|uniref:hypothetical protein n=1 Tax=Dyella sp. TaxID=1869338 RepID=UPI002CACEB6E|nr:hypothetical protein [Dyella sp.]HTV87343.1 hypothetical protein [Dyella sp.]
MEKTLDGRRSREGAQVLAFALLTFVLVLSAHAAAYLSHEYAHSVMAWLLGWMKQPFGIDYGAASFSNDLFLGDVSDNVDYAAIFSAGHGMAAAAIALSGPMIGNGLLYFIIYALMSTAWVGRSRYLMMFLYWLSLMCAGNVWSYVPIRALTWHADIALAARGLGISVWVLFPFLMAVSAFITWHFMTRSVARVVAWASVPSLNLIVLIAVTGFWYFPFFVGDAIDGSYGMISQVLAMVSRYVLFPLAVAWLYQRYVEPCLRRTVVQAQ